MRVTGRASPYNINRLTLYTKQGDLDVDDNDGFENVFFDDIEASPYNSNRLTFITSKVGLMLKDDEDDDDDMI